MLGCAFELPASTRRTEWDRLAPLKLRLSQWSSAFVGVTGRNHSNSYEEEAASSFLPPWEHLLVLCLHWWSADRISGIEDGPPLVHLSEKCPPASCLWRWWPVWSFWWWKDSLRCSGSFNQGGWSADDLWPSQSEGQWTGLPLKCAACHHLWRGQCPL